MKLLRSSWRTVGLGVAGLVLGRLAWAMLRPTRSPAALATAESQFIDVNGVRVHYTQAGQGEPTLVLLHGSFLNHSSWQAVTAPLATQGRVIALDRPAFGLTERVRPTDEQNNPYGPLAQADLIGALLERLAIQDAVLVGNSAGGTLALLAALRHPARVRGLVLAAAMVYNGYAVTEMPPHVRARLRKLGPLGPLHMRLLIDLLHDTVVRSFWHDRTRVTSEMLAAARLNIRVQGWSRALWELILSSHALNLEAQLDQVQVPALVLSGEADRAVPVEYSLRLARQLPAAELVLLPACGHLPQEEQPDRFAEAVRDFVARRVIGTT